MEDVVLRLDRRMARISAVRVTFGIGRELIGCGVVVEYGVSPSAAFRKSFAVLFHHESLGKDVWHFHGERGLRALLQLPLELDDPGPLRERLAVTGDAGFIRVDHRGIRDDHLEYFGRSGGGDVSPVLVSPEVGERNSARRYQRVLALVLALREKGRGTEDGEHCHGCRNDGKAAGTFHGGACFYLLFLLFLRHRSRHKFGHFYIPPQESFASPNNVHRERLQLDQTEGSKINWAIPSSNCATHFLLAQWSRRKIPWQLRAHSTGRGMSQIGSDTIWAKLRATQRDSKHRICNEHCIRKEPSMNAVQVDQKSYEMPPKDGISIAHFLTVADVERSARYYEKVFGARILTMGDGNAPPYLQLANIWMILNVGGGPTPDKPTVTLSVPDPNHINSFLNFRVADIQACYELWKSRGAEFITPPIPKYGEIRCYIRDPDGYIIEVGQSTDLTYG